MRAIESGQTTVMLTLLLTLGLLGCANPFAKPATPSKTISKTSLSDDSLKKVEIANQVPNADTKNGAISQNYLDDVTTKNPVSPLQNPAVPLLPRQSNQALLDSNPYQNIGNTLQNTYRQFLLNP